jgi:hypothetical protein
MEVSGHLHASAALPPVPVVKEDGLGPKAGLDVMEKILMTLTRIEPRFLGRPALNLVAIPNEFLLLLKICYSVIFL